MPVTAPDNSRAIDIGAHLRDAREARGASLEEAAQVTRIGKNYLLAIEGGTFDKLPNPAYVRGFLRIYAKYLELSPDAIVARYDESLMPVGKPTEAPVKVRPEPDLNRREGKKGRWAVPAILLAATLIIAALMNTMEHKQAAIPTPSPERATRPSPLQPVRSSTTLPQGAPLAGAEAEATRPAPSTTEPSASGIILKLKANQDSWLNITIDDAVSQSYDLKSGDIIEWKAEKNFTLDLGNAGGIEAEFNGKPLRPFGEPGKPAHVVLKAEGS